MTRESHARSLEGVVEEAFPGLLFRVSIPSLGHDVLAHPKGKMKLNRIRVIPGDRVVVEFTPYDDIRGRIIRRL